MRQRKGSVQRIVHCSACSQFLDLREGEVATVCSRCGQGYHLERGQWRQVQVQFSLNSSERMAPEDVAAITPFWVFTTEMPLELMNMWDNPDPFAGLDIYVPGHALLWDERLTIGVRLTSWQPQFVFSSVGSLMGCTMTRQEALEMAPLIYMRVLQQVGGLSVSSDPGHLPLLASKLLVLPRRFSQEELL